MAWYHILAISAAAIVAWIVLSAILYKVFFKRFYDIMLSGLALIILSPLFMILTIVGAIKMKGNPFFVQLRPGKISKSTGKEKIFKLIKFRTMTCEKDVDGNLLQDEKRLTKYGKILRALSLDELPELFNIFIGDMSIVGPRPLLVKYLDRYDENQRHRHDIRPGLTGYAQCKGRNAISWEEKFNLDLYYVNNFSLWLDLKIIFNTIVVVLKKEGIHSESSSTMEEFIGKEEGKK